MGFNSSLLKTYLQQLTSIELVRHIFDFKNCSYTHCTTRSSFYGTCSAANIIISSSVHSISSDIKLHLACSKIWLILTASYYRKKKNIKYSGLPNFQKIKTIHVILNSTCILSMLETRTKFCHYDNSDF